MPLPGLGRETLHDVLMASLTLVSLPREFLDFPLELDIRQTKRFQLRLKVFDDSLRPGETLREVLVDLRGEFNLVRFAL